MGVRFTAGPAFGSPSRTDTIAVLQMTVPVKGNDDPFIESWVWVVVGIASALAVTYVWRGYKSSASSSKLRRLGLVVSALAFVVAVIRTFMVPSSTKGPWVPNLDIVTVAWFSIGTLGALAQLLLENRTKLTSESSRAVDVLSMQKAQFRATGDALVKETASVVRHWATVLNDYIADAWPRTFFIDEDDDGETCARPVNDGWEVWLNQFIIARLSEASEWLSPGDLPQITVWLSSEHLSELYIAFSNQRMSPKLFAVALRFDQGIAGAAFSEHIGRNEVEPAKNPLFYDFGDSWQYEYKSMLALPVDYGSRRLGVLCVDRMQADYFDDATVFLMKALAAILGIALGVAEM